MSKYKHILLFILILIADVIWLSFYTSELFDKNSQLLFLFMTTRIGLILVARVFKKATGNWLYYVFSAAYLFFSFAVASLFYLSTNAAAAY